MSLDSFRVRKGLIVDGGSTTTGSATVNGSVILTGSTSGQVSLTAPAVAGAQGYTLPTALPPVNNYVLTSQTDGTMGWAAGSSVTTTYTIDASSTTGGANLNLTGSDASVDSVKYSSGTGVTVSSPNVNTIDIAIGQSVGTTDTVTFNTVNANLTGNVTGTVSSLSNHTTTDLAEGTNLYYTDARARGALSAGTGISYNSTTGVITSTITQYTDAMARAAVSATTTGDGSLVYNNTTGVFAYTGPGASNYRAALSGGTGISYNSTTGVISSTITQYTDAMARAALSGGTGVIYNNTTGVIAIGQDVGTTATVTFNTVNANLTGNVTGTVSSLSNHTTTDLAEGTNLYYTDARARAALSAGTGISYNNTTGVISSTITQYTDAMARAALSATTSGDGSLVYNNTTGVFAYTGPGASNYRAAVSATSTGDGSLVYNSSTGVFAYTGPSATNYRASLSGGTGVTYNSSTGVIAIGQDVATTANVTFASVTTPTLKAADGTTALTLANTTGDVTANRYIQVNGNRILNSAGTPTFYFDTSGNASVASNFTILGNILRAWNGSASVTAITMSATGDITTAGNLTVGSNLIKAADGATALTLTNTTGDVTTAGNLTVGGNNIKASDGTTAATLAVSTGDITFASRLLSSASKTIRQGSNRTTSYASVTGATAEDILINGIGASGAPSNGLLITNADLPTASTSGRRPTILIRGYGGQEYNGVASTTAPQPYYAVESSRGTFAEPRALNNGQPMGSFIGSSNAGSDATSGNTPYWTSQNYPAYPSFGLRTFQNHRGPYSSTAGAAFFVATIAAASTSLVVSSVTSGTILLGQEIKLITGNFTTTTNTFQIIAQVSGTTGGAGTYTLNANPGTYTSATAMYSCNTTLGSGFFLNAVPNDTPITTASRVTSQVTPDLIQFRAQSVNSGTNIFELRGWATTNYGGTGTTFQQGTNALYLGVSSGTTTVGNTLSVQQTIKTAATTMQLQTSAGVGLTGNNIDYNRVYGQWQWDATVTAAASNTAYAFPIQGASGVTDYANIASVSSTSRIIPGAAGMYKIQFSVQVTNADNGAEHTAYFWWRKNGTDVPSSMGRITCPKGGSTIGGWDNVISSANATDYWELYYATDDSTNISFPYYGTTAFGPSTAALFITLIPIGA